VAAELGDRRAVGARDGNVVDAAAAAAGALDAMGCEPVSELRRTQERHRTMLRHGALAVAVAGEGEGRIGECEDEAAVADPLPVGHALPDRHGEGGAARRDVEDFHAEALRRTVVGPHRLGAPLGQRQCVT
jgi:hypothetical protein